MLNIFGDFGWTMNRNGCTRMGTQKIPNKPAYLDDLKSIIHYDNLMENLSRLERFYLHTSFSNALRGLLIWF